MAKKYDFSGYVTRNDIKCTDGRTIRKNAFKHQDGVKVPLVWQHLKADPSNILGYAMLEHREDGVYGYGVFNETASAKDAKELVKHGDIEALSIHANQLNQVVLDVMHGMIREVSLVVTGANLGAFIDNVCITHADGSDTEDLSEAIIFSGEKISTEEIEHAEKVKVTTVKEETVGDVFETFSDKQKDVVYGMISEAIDAVTDDATNELKQSDDSAKDDSAKDDSDKDNSDKDIPTDGTDDIQHKNEGGTNMKKNIFASKETDKENKQVELSHADVSSIFTKAKKAGSLKDAFLEHAGTYGIDNIDYLFPDAVKLRTSPDFIKREDDWVTGVISGTNKTPFSRIKSVSADITPDEARAKGYVKEGLKAEEVFGLLKRITTPTTIYKKQKLDRDDIIDITDMDVVAWLKMEMRMLLDEEIARAILVGDGRTAGHVDKITEANIRPVYKDDDMYNHKVTIAATADTTDMMEAILRARTNYKGTGKPAFYTTPEILTDMLLLKDTTGHRFYKNESEVAQALRVSKVVEVPVMEGLEREDGDDTHDLLGIVLNIRDYTVGADKGGKISMFDDFDIDYNQHKYLIEGRMSGALTVPKSALTVERTQAGG
jgi:HK97 family phage prohead protease